MKKIFSLVCGFSALLLASCSSEEPINTGTQNGSDGSEDFYANLTLRLPSSSGTRANNGEEFGKDFENNVGKILVVLCTKDADGRYQKVAVAQSDAMLSDPLTAQNEVKYVLNFKASDFNSGNPLGTGSTLPGTQQIYVFAYCNPTSTLYDRFVNNDDVFRVDNVNGTLANGTDSEIWRPNQFLMTNCEISTPVNMPTRTDLVTNHNVPEKAFNLGTVKVKRVSARFDFATTTVDETLGANKYPVKNLDGTGNMGVVELTDMAMFNVQKSFYYLPRTSPTATGWGWSVSAANPSPVNYVLCGDLEDFVMSYNPNGFKNTLSSDDDSQYYFCNLINNDLSMSDEASGDNLNWVSIKPEVWNQHDVDNDEGWTGGNGDYRIWRYCTENTIPRLSSEENTTQTRSQRYGISTGVVFRGEFTPNDKSVWNGNVIYVHNNIVYGDLAALKEYVEANPDTKVATEFNAIRELKNASLTPENLKADLLKNVSNSLKRNFKTYVNSEAYTDSEGQTAYKYIMYYFYFNRHKSNGNNSLMANDEFGVVRNNVYKLSVTNIRSLGDPVAPNDPDTPNEQENAYFTVSCLVMPWTVRVNNIEF